MFEDGSTQEEVYRDCVSDLVMCCFDGFNATILAYGQTGSGKTYTMGSGGDLGQARDSWGIIPRAAQQIFAECERRKAEAGTRLRNIEIKVEFMELYADEIYDLLVPTGSGGGMHTGEEGEGSSSSGAFLSFFVCLV